jgi:hypothetical protein
MFSTISFSVILGLERFNVAVVAPTPVAGGGVERLRIGARDHSAV